MHRLAPSFRVAYWQLRWFGPDVGLLSGQTRTPENVQKERSDRAAAQIVAASANGCECDDDSNPGSMRSAIVWDVHVRVLSFVCVRVRVVGDGWPGSRWTRTACVAVSSAFLPPAVSDTPIGENRAGSLQSNPGDS